MVIPFFYCKGFIHIEWVLQNQTVTKEYHFTVFKKFREKMKKKRPQQWKNGKWLFHQDNAPCYRSTLVTERGMKLIQHSPDSTDLVPRDFFLFPRIEKKSQGHQISVNEELKEASETYLKGLLDNEFEGVFQDWKRRIQKCIGVKGHYFEGDNVL